jgi:small-conductance mechanosensitive channel
MDNNTVSKLTVPFGLSVAVCAVVNALLVIVKEKSTAVTAWMQKLTGHHWITHVAIVLVLFALLGWIFSRANGGQGPAMPLPRLTRVVLSGAVAGVLIVLGFYVIAD